MSTPTELHLPPAFPYPIKLVSLDVTPATSIERGTRLLTYSFVHIPATPDTRPETRFGTWDSAIEGTVLSWNVKPGEIISQRRAKDKPVILVTEPCKHGVQIGGLCGLCGKDMTDYDYTGFSDASRASIQMTHSAFGPTVSFEEAQRIERETAEHLLKSRRLSLIVDLDQTIVHATVDPTVGEWISDGEAWEARQAKKASTSKDTSNDDSNDSDDTESESDDECNPNWEALKDVKKFRLGPESFGAPQNRNPQKGKGKQKVESDGCMYYIKPRPGWKEFLRETATKYEMHVYTMGTRAYAEEVCTAIDPDGKIFGGRLLSRDESGSLTQKSLQRLFPCDTSMVVIIDDRADVWEWSPNLIKVIPYDFFVGIGDINSTFLPKVEQLSAVVPPRPSPGDIPELGDGSTRTTDPSSSTGSDSVPESESTLPTVPSQTSPEDLDREELAAKAMLTQNSLALEAQLEERPLAKKQEELQDASAGADPSHLEGMSESENEKASMMSPINDPPSPKHDKGTRKALLKNDDKELDRISKLLDEVHTRFFSAYDKRTPDVSAKKRKQGRPYEKTPMSYDVTTIIPRIRTETFEGVHILFSSVIPLDTKPEVTEIWRMAHMFGATCYTELSSRITHVVAAKRGTVKVDMARKRGGIKIVWLAWFTDSIALWHRQDETPYLLDDLPATAAGLSPTLDPNQISSDPEPDADDWDGEEVAGGSGSPSLELAEIDWNDINDEVEAAMNESEDEDGDGDDARSDRSGVRSANVSDDESDDMNSTTSSASVNSTPRLKRKRLRSMTPSEIGINGNGDRDVLRSPLSKRKKLAAERTGYSKLKETISADDLVENKEPSNGIGPPPNSTSGDEMEEDGEDNEDEEDDDGEEEDDFLARELEEEWG